MFHVLIVDDDLTTQLDLAQMLLPLARASAVSSGAEALARVEQSLRSGDSFHCIFMDILMPHQDGLATVRQLVELFNERRIPMAERPRIVMLSCENERDIQIDALYGYGADGFLAKPLDEPTLLAALRELQLIAPA